MILMTYSWISNCK